MSQESNILRLVETLAKGKGAPKPLNAQEWPVLYVDDSEEQRSLMEMIFRSTGFPIVTRGDARDLPKHIAKNNIKVIYLDLDLGRENGLAVLKELKNNKATSKIPVLMLTATSDRETILQAVQAGCDGYIVKPLTETIIPKTCEVIERKYLGEEVVKSSMKQYPANTELINEQKPQRILYVIKSGVVRIHILRHGRDVNLATLGPGDIFGEESFLTGAMPSAMATTESDVSVLELESTQDVQSFWGQHFGLKEIFLGVSKKLRKANEAIAILSYQNYVVARHQGVDLSSETLYAEVLRLMTLTKMIYAAEGPKAVLSVEAFHKKLERLACETPLSLKSFINALTNHGFMVLRDRELILENAALDGMLGRLVEAERDGRFVILDHVVVNVLKLLEALHRDGEKGVPFTIETKVVNPSSAQDVHDSLRFLADLGIITFVDEEKTQVRYVPVKLSFFLKWQGVLMDLSPPQLARTVRLSISSKQKG